MKKEIPPLDRLNLNPTAYRHEDFTYQFNDLMHREKLQGKEFKSMHVDDQNTVFVLTDLEEGDKELKVRFDKVDTYKMETICNVLYNELGPDDLGEEKFSADDIDMLEGQKDYMLRSWHILPFSLKLTVIDRDSLYITVQTRFN